MATVINRTSATLNNTAVADLDYIADVSGEVIAARSETAINALIATAAARESGTTLFSTYDAAFRGATALTDGGYVKVLVDETKNGQQSIYQIDLPGNITLDIDFTTQTAQIGSINLDLVFVAKPVLNYVGVPLTSTSTALAGDIAIDTDFLYVAVGINQWKRIALGAF